jgi:Glycosyltransferase family 92
MTNISWRHLMLFAALILVSSMTSFISYLLGNFYSGVDSGITAHDYGKKRDLSVAFCVLAKNERDLYEWIDYHRQLNVSKFYVLDEHSNPPMSQQIPNFISSGLVEYQQYSFSWTNALQYVGYQTKNHLRIAFDDCLRMHGHKHDWLGFLDADEFVILKVCFPFNSHFNSRQGVH